MKKDYEKSHKLSKGSQKSYRERKAVSKKSNENRKVRKISYPRCEVCFKRKAGSAETKKVNKPVYSASVSRSKTGKVIIAWDSNPKIESPPKRRLKYINVKSPNINNTDEYSHNSQIGNSIHAGEHSK